MINDTYCNLWPDNVHRCDVIVGLKRATASFSLIGSLLMIFLIWLLRKYSTFSQRLILYLTIGAFMQSTAYLMTDMQPDGPLCDFEGFWMTYWDWAVMLWVCAITWCLFFSVARETRADRFKWSIHLVCWLLPLVIACLPFAGDHYGPAGAWCWIKSDTPEEHHKSWRFGIWYVPLFIVIIVLFCVYLYIVCLLRSKISSWTGTNPDEDREKELLKADVNQLRVYPCIYLLTAAFPFINRVQNAANPDNPVFALWILHVLSSPLQGFFNALVFGFDRETRQHLTPAQLKLALQNRFRSRPEIEEYPTNDQLSYGEQVPYNEF